VVHTAQLSVVIDALVLPQVQSPCDEAGIAQ